MLGKIKELSKEVPQSTDDAMWAEARQIMADGQASATEDRCTKVREKYMIARPYMFGTQPNEMEKAPL